MYLLTPAISNRLLYLVDANTFASLTVLSRQWRRVSNSSELYAYHLSRCSLYSLTNNLIAGPTNPQDLPHLKKKFAREIRRNNFEVFRRPHRTMVQLISSSTGSATALPYGEALKFFFSSNGRFLICLSSARVFILDLTTPEVKVIHSLKVRSRPSIASINEDGSLLAIVTSRVQVNIYQLGLDEVKLVQHLVLSDFPRTLALSPGKSIFAVAYEEGIELFALGENALSTQRRAVRCSAVDSLSFVGDGLALFGSSMNLKKPGLVTVNAPLPSDGTLDVAASDAQNQIWSTQVLFPELIPAHSHASLLTNQVGPDSDWVLTFDHDIGAYRVVRTCDPKSGVIFFVGPCKGDQMDESLPDIAPAVDPCGELAAVSFDGSGIWLYGLPDRLDVTLASTATVGAYPTQTHQQEAGSHSREDDSITTNSQRLRRTIRQPSLLIRGNRIAEFPAVTAARWVPPSASPESKICHRLVAVAPGGVPSSTLGEESIALDGGRLLILDFEASPRDKVSAEITIELGETEAKVLEEHRANLEQEVELERQRTQVTRRPVGSPRRVIDGERGSGAQRQSFPVGRSSSQRSILYSHRASRSNENSPVEATLDDLTLFLDGPYTNAAPRSRDTLHRAATSAAAVRRRDTPQRRPAMPGPFPGHIPHESDADNWVPPPPPYTRNADGPLPEHVRRLLLPSRTEPPLRSTQQTIPRRPHTSGRDSAAAAVARDEQPEVFTAQTESSSGRNVLSGRSRRRSSVTDGQRINRTRSLFIGRRDSGFARTDSVSPAEQTVPPRPSFSRHNSHTSAPQPSTPQPASNSLNDSHILKLIRRKSLSRPKIFANNIFHRNAVDSHDDPQGVPALPSNEGRGNINRMSTIYSVGSRGLGHTTNRNLEQRQTQAQNFGQVPRPEDFYQFRNGENMRASPHLPQPDDTGINQSIPPINHHNRIHSAPVIEYYNNAESLHESDGPEANQYLNVQSHSQTDPWRARIEAWNIQTINEIRRTGDPNPDKPPSSRQLLQHYVGNKCVIM